MDILKEINRLPQYYYEFDDRYMILGGQSCPDEPVSCQRLYQLWKQIKDLYDKDNLTIDEKVHYAKLVKRMARWSQSGTMSKKELGEKINTLSEKEREDIEWQIEMYKKGREYHREYI